MKTIIVGDLHLKAQLILPIVAENTIKYSCTQIILTGDYTDDWGQRQNTDLYLEELNYIINWKSNMKQLGINVITLLGNHDSSYLVDELLTYSLQNREGFKMVSEKLLKLEVQIAFNLDDYLISHAGYCYGQELKDWHLKILTLLELEGINNLNQHVGLSRGGRYYTGSPLWADYNLDLLDLPNPKFPKQIVGHTPVSEIDLLNSNLINIDTFNLNPISEYPYYEFIGNGDLLLYDDKSKNFSVLKTDWRKNEIIEKLLLSRNE